MRLRRLELQGFKSFVDRTIVQFESRITGVVGPNGCGKSNIVDAILWVMGEQSAKHLRGESMTDVIFNGSENRAPTSMAEVSLILDKQGVMLAPQFAAIDKADEICITRRIYRDGQGEYLINKQPCRLKDIHELFMDTGVGRRAYSIIEQGQIDRMINVKPEERRFLFEEVAGITKYKAKKREAEKKLELTQQNLLRLQDIMSELERQMRSLKIQATRARKYREIKSELETVDLHLIGRTLYQLEKTMADISVRRQDLIELRSQADAELATADSTITELDLKRIDLEKQFQSETEAERSLAISLEKLDGVLSLCGERRNFILHNSDQLAKEMAGLEGQLRGLRDELSLLVATTQEQKAQLVLQQGEILSLEDNKRAIGESIASCVKDKRAAEDSQRKLIQSQQRLESQIIHGVDKESELVRHAEIVNRKLSQIVIDLDEHNRAMSDVNFKIEAVSQRHAEAESNVSRVASDLRDLSTRLSSTENELFEQREIYHRRNSRLQSLEELSHNYEGYSPTAREVRNTIADSHSIPLPEVLRPDGEFEEHVEHILANEMNTLLTQTAAEAERLTELIHESGLDRVGIIALEEIASGVGEVCVDVAVSVLDKVRAVPGFEKIADRFLGKAFVCSDRAELFRMRRQYPHYTFITRDGKVVARGDGSLTCGQLKKSAGIFARRREIESLQSECVQLKSHMDETACLHQKLLETLEAQERFYEDLKNTLSSIHVERVELRKEKEKIQIELSRIDADYEAALRDSESNRVALEALRKNMQEWHTEQTQLGFDAQDLDNRVVAADQNISSFQLQVDGIAQRLEQIRMSVSALNERVCSLELQHDKTVSNIDRGEARIRSLGEQIGREEVELLSIDEQTARTISERDTKNFERGRLLEAIGLIKTEFDAVCGALYEIRDKKESVAKQRVELQERYQAVELQLQQELANKDHLTSIAGERYQRSAVAVSEYVIMPLERIPLLADQLSVDWLSMEGADRERLLEEHLQNLRQKVERYGEVNLTAIQEFEEIEGRFSFLTKQKNDLDHAVSVLLQAITKIDETTKTRFEETFHVVNAKFKEIFPILFNGGKAELALAMGASGDAGIDVMVQPPGKRLQSMSLLSGGEKALTAVSLILSIFARKPSPFCLLDEVDAPLDDANVSRFNTVIRKMSQKTQFIVITHNKKTMEMAEALYGVTMERAGVSKMTSVSLN